MSDQTKACTKCGETKPLEGFSPSNRGSSGRNAHCKACRAAYAKSVRKAKPGRPGESKRRWETWAARNPESARLSRRTSEATRTAAVQAMSRDAARNNGKEWTGPELELAADPSRSARDVARAIGRTKFAIHRMRHKIHTDPRKARMAGTDVEVQS